MRPDKFTQKMQEALQAAQEVAAVQPAGNFERAFSGGVARPDGWRDAAVVGEDGRRDRGFAWAKSRRRWSGGRRSRAAMSISADGNELRGTIDAAEKLKDEFLSAEYYLLALSA
jgi:hypothetical protein